jgi:hypothetical protein
MAMLQQSHNCQDNQDWFPVVSSVVGVVGLEEAMVMMAMATLAFPRLDYPSVRRVEIGARPFLRIGTRAAGNCRDSSATATRDHDRADRMTTLQNGSKLISPLPLF